MRKNIFLKSMLRQPVRTGLMVLLIGLATFAFYLRTVEYIVVREQIIELSGLYRSVGFIRPQNFWDDVSEAVEIISNSPHIGTIDRRVSVEGVLHNVRAYNEDDITHETRRSTIADIGGLYPGVAHTDQLRVSEAIFYAQLEAVHLPQNPGDILWVVTQNAHILAGIPHQVIAGSWPGLWLGYWTNEDTDFSIFTDFENMEIGSYYLFKAAFYVIPHPLGGFVIPRIGGNEHMTLRPLGGYGGPWFTTSVPYVEDAGLWPVEMRRGYVGIDFSIPELSHIPDYIRFLQHNHSAVQLVATTDMNSLPMMQEWAAARLGYLDSQTPQIMRLHEGRFIDKNDYNVANNVIVVSRTFAQHNNIFLGDILEINIPATQQIVGVSQVYGEIVVRGNVEESPSNLMEFEVVGIFTDFTRGVVSGAPIMYIPTSVLPDNLEILPPTPGAISGWDSPYHLPSVWYSFTLQDPRTDQAFLQEYTNILAELSQEIDLIIFESDAAGFWAAIDPMMLVVTFNAAVFWAVLLLALALVVFLYLGQRRKDMAIQRALGFSVARIIRRLLVSAMVFVIPPAVVGGIFGWHHALNTVELALQPLTEIVAEPTYIIVYETVVDLRYMLGFANETTPVINISMLWFLWMVVGLLAVTLIMMLFGAIKILRYPVLEQLQGVVSKPKKQKPQKILDEVKPIVLTDFTIPRYTPVFTTGEKHRGGFRWIVRHITRSPVKSMLGLAVALFFVLVLGWLQESIVRTKQNIDYLYAHTIVWGEVVQDNTFAQHTDRYLGDVIRLRTAERVLDSGFVENVYMESGHSRAFVIPAADDGSFPENWYDIIGYDRSRAIWFSLHTMDFMFAFNDLDRFIDLNSFDENNRFEIEFAEGFDKSDFTSQDGPIPILVSENVLYERGISLGEIVYIGFSPAVPTAWESVEAVVIGVHNGHVARVDARETIFMCLTQFENIMAGMTMYSTFSFTINPAYNREIAYVREHLTSIVLARNAGLLLLRLFLSDQTLHNLIGVATQTLLLIELVYPVAMAAALAIASGLAMLLMLQNAKKAATLHVLGMSKISTMVMLLVEQLLVCLAGMAVGLIALALMNVNFSQTLVISFGLYLAGVFITSLVGAGIIIRREPLELLQVRE